MNIKVIFFPIIFAMLLAACGGDSVTPTPTPVPTPGTDLPTVPPGVTPVNPTPTPTPGNGSVPYYGEWIIT